MKRVYVAGKLNDDACGYIKNLHKMIDTARKIRKLGFAVYVPCNDFMEGLVDGNFKYSDYFDNSQAWLDASDAVFLTPGWETSLGTLKEIERAKSRGIPIFSNLEKLVKLNENLDK